MLSKFLLPSINRNSSNQKGSTPFLAIAIILILLLGSLTAIYLTKDPSFKFSFAQEAEDPSAEPAADDPGPDSPAGEPA